MTETEFKIGDRVRRCVFFAHGNHASGHECTIRSFARNDTYFFDGTDNGNEYGPYMYKLSNYELIHRSGDKKRSGFGKFINRVENEIPKSST